MTALEVLLRYADHLDAGTAQLALAESPTTAWVVARRDFDDQLRRATDWDDLAITPEGMAALSTRRAAASRFEAALRFRLAALEQAIASARRAKTAHRAYRDHGPTSAYYVQQRN